MPLYPKHNYLGPGNNNFNGEPVDRADEIAQQHDWDYSTSFNKQQIFNSDKKAIDLFKQDLDKGFNLPSFVGKTGLQIKNFFESSLNRTLYPFNLPDEAEQSMNKKQKTHHYAPTDTDPTVGERQASHAHNFPHDSQSQEYIPFLSSDESTNGEGSNTAQNIMDTTDNMQSDVQL